MVDKVRPILHESLAEKKGVVFWVAVQVSSSHSTKDLDEISPKYLGTVRRTLFHLKDIEDRLDEVVQKILLRNAHFTRDNSGFVLGDILRMHYKADEYLPLMDRAYQELPQFLTQKASINVQNQEDRSFGKGVLAAVNPLP